MSLDKKDRVPPESAKNNAKRVLEWRKKYGNQVKGMTSVGWTRANQLASGNPLSDDVIKRMAQFERHRKNAKIDPKYKNEPWRDNGYVAWLGWGGSTGIGWAKRMSNKIKKKSKMESQGDIINVSEISDFVKWSRKYINDLPDSAFLFIEVGGIKDEEGKTVPRSLRHLPYKNDQGKVDIAHLRNAIQRASQVKLKDGSNISEKKAKELQNKARRILPSKGGNSKMSDDLKTDEVSVFNEENLDKLKDIIQKLENAESLESAKLLVVELKGFLPSGVETEEKPKEEVGEAEDTLGEEDKEEEKTDDEEKEEGVKEDTQESEVQEEEKKDDEVKGEDDKEEASSQGEDSDVKTQLSDALDLNQKMISKLQEADNQIKTLEKINDKLKLDNSELTKKVSMFEEAKEKEEKERYQSKFNDVFEKYCDFMDIPDNERDPVRKQMSTFSEDGLDNTLRYLEKKKETLMESEEDVVTQPSSDFENKEEVSVMTQEKYKSMSARDKTDYLFSLLSKNENNS